MSVKKEKMLAKEGLLEPELVFDIDKNRLDDEWLNQPKRYFQWAVQLEDARADVDEAKRAFDVAKAEFDEVKAEVELTIRNKPDKFNLPKVTDKSIAAVLIMQPEYKEAQKELFKTQKAIDIAKHRAGVLQAAVTALDQRKKALEKLVDLHGQKYFATPRASENSREAMEEVEKQSVRAKAKPKSAKRKPMARS